jgi:peptide/nickel transport system permease protein
MKKQIGYWISATWLGFIVFLAIFGQWLPITDWDEPDYDNTGLTPFSSFKHPLGTDGNGFDIFSGLVQGSRVTMLVALLSVLFGGIIGSALGITAAYFRGKFDGFMNIVFSVVLSIPNLVLSLSLVSILAYSDEDRPTTDTRRIVVLILSLTIVIIPILGRIARATALQWANREFVVASKSMGTRNLRIIREHLLPNVAPAILAIAFLAVGVVIIAEGSLAVLGVGVPNGKSWGSQLANSIIDIEFNPQAVYVPALFIAFTVIAVNYFGDYIRKSLDRREAKI